LLGDRSLVDAVLEDYRTAPLSDRDKALFGFIQKMNEQSNQIRREDIEGLKEHGWTDEAVYDAITVCSLFRFYNAWIDATGVHDLPAAAYQLSGKRLAEQGYIRTAESEPARTSPQISR
jgi:hypothetical protein